MVYNFNNLSSLNDTLADNSYIEGYQPSSLDALVFDNLPEVPGDSLPHALRWYNHIKSYGDERKKFPGDKLDPAKHGFGGAASKDDDDDDVDLFGSDSEEEDADAAKVREERLKAYAAKKSGKPQLIAKSSVILEVKPWDDETDMKELEKSVRVVATEGLLWGASKLVPVGYGINKLQIMCTVEDEKVSIDWLQEEIEKDEDHVQSVDVVAFNKV